MKHTEIKLRSLTNYEDHTNAIDAIENDYLNVEGGLTAWNSGNQTYLLKGAKDKIEKINARIERLFCTEEIEAEEREEEQARIERIEEVKENPHFPAEDWHPTETENLDVKIIICFEGIDKNTVVRTPIRSTYNPQAAMKIVGGFGFDVISWEFTEKVSKADKIHGLREAVKEISIDLTMGDSECHAILTNRYYRIVDALREEEESEVLREFVDDDVDSLFGVPVTSGEWLAEPPVKEPESLGTLFEEEESARLASVKEPESGVSTLIEFNSIKKRFDKKRVHPAIAVLRYFGFKIV